MGNRFKSLETDSEDEDEQAGNQIESENTWTKVEAKKKRRQDEKEAHISSHQIESCQVKHVFPQKPTREAKLLKNAFEKVCAQAYCTAMPGRCEARQVADVGIRSIVHVTADPTKAQGKKVSRRWPKVDVVRSSPGTGTATNNNSRKGGEMLALQTIVPMGVNTVDVKGDWEELKMAVDSGATETVMSEDMLTCTETKIGTAAKRGVEYEVANGVTTPNLGEKTFAFEMAEGAERKIPAQICDVNKGLLSVVKMVNAGNTVVFSKSGSFIEDDNSGERISINEENGVYVLSM